MTHHQSLAGDEEWIPIIPSATAVSEPEFSYLKSKKPLNDANNVNGKVLLMKGRYLDKTLVAMKRYQHAGEEQKALITMMDRDLAVLRAPQNLSEHFVRYFGTVTDDSFTYVATELCLGSIADVIERKKFGINLSGKEILRQSAQGVAFLHSLGFIHRNLSPDNFLVAEVQGKMLVKLTDFRFSRFFRSSDVIFQSGNKHLYDWTAPECQVENMILLPAVDVFILGCYFFYVLTGGGHPFGSNSFDRSNNMRSKIYPAYSGNWNPNVKMNKQELSLIQTMIQQNPFERPTLESILQDHYFLPEDTYHLYHEGNGPKPGLCVIVNQEIFKKLKTRDGTDEDAISLYTTFKGFGFDVLLYKNLTARQMLHLVQDLVSSGPFDNEDNKFSAASRKVDFKDYASLVFCILSHGDKGVVCGVDDKEVSINQLKYAFNSLDCPALMGKPKIFIIQACRGNYPQPAIVLNEDFATDNHQQIPSDVDFWERTFEASSDEAEGTIAEDSQRKGTFKASGRLLEAMMIQEKSVRHRLPPLIDILSLLSTVEEFVSFRNTVTGSHFVQILCKTLTTEYGNKKSQENKRHLCRLFQEEVVDKVSQKLTGGSGTQTPELCSTLRMNVIFSRQKQERPPIMPDDSITEDGWLEVTYDGLQDPGFAKERNSFQKGFQCLKELYFEMKKKKK